MRGCCHKRLRRHCLQTARYRRVWGAWGLRSASVCKRPLWGVRGELRRPLRCPLPAALRLPRAGLRRGGGGSCGGCFSKHPAKRGVLKNMPGIHLENRRCGCKWGAPGCGDPARHVLEKPAKRGFSKNMPGIRLENTR